MRKFWQDFKKFITRGNVVDMAVGVAVASAFTAIVTAFTKGFITPLLALLTNNSDLSEMKWVIRPAQTHLDEAGAEIVDVAEVALLWGAFVQKIIDFLIIAFVLFLVLRIVTRVAERSAKIRERMINAVTDRDEKAAEEAAKAAAEAEAAKAAAEAEAKAAEEAARLAEEEEENRKKAEITLLTEIRDLLKSKAD